MHIVVFLLAFGAAVFSLTRAYLKVLDKVADDLYALFQNDEDRWWWEKELPGAIGKHPFVTKAALKLLDEQVGLLKEIRLISAIRVYPREGGEYLGAQLVVKLDNNGPRRRKKRVEVVRTKMMNIFGHAPTYT